jgi:hypothetical protein
MTVRLCRNFRSETIPAYTPIRGMYYRDEREVSSRFFGHLPTKHVTQMLQK